MKVFKYIVWGLLLFFGLFYLLPAGLLQVPYVQTKISHVGAELLEKEIGTEVRIGRVEFQLFNKLILKDLYLEDQAGDTLLTAKRVAASFDVLPLFRKKLRFGSAQLFTFDLRLSKDSSTSPLNVQYIIDAFSKEEKDSDSPIDLRINHLNLRLGKLSYRVKDQQEMDDGLFNPNNMAFTNLSVKLGLRDLNSERLDLTVERLSLRDKSGLQIRRMHFDLLAEAGQITIDRLLMEMANSSLRLSDIEAKYIDTDDARSWLDKIHFNLLVNTSDLYPKDLSPLLPVFAHYEDKVTLEGKAYGKINEIFLDDCSFYDRGRFAVHATAQVDNITHTAADSIFINGFIDESFLTPMGAERLLINFNSDPSVLPFRLPQLGSIYFDGNVRGSLDNLTALGNFRSDIGDLAVSVNLGKKETFFMTGQLSTLGLDIHHLLENPDFGSAIFAVDANLRIDSLLRPSGSIIARVDSFDYKGYRYENAALDGRFTHQGFNGSLALDGTDGRLEAQGLFLLQGEDSRFEFHAEASNLLLDKLNITKKYQEPNFSFALDADFRGNKANNMLGEISFRDIRFETARGAYQLDSLTIESLEDDGERLITLNSDILTGEMRGTYRLSDLIPSLRSELASYMPSFFAPSKRKYAGQVCDYSFAFHFSDCEEFSDILELPFVIDKQGAIVGTFSSEASLFELNAHFPRVTLGNSPIEELRLSIDNHDEQLQLELNGLNIQRKGGRLAFHSALQAKSDTIRSVIDWKNNLATAYEGNLNLLASLSRNNSKSPVSTTIQIDSEQLIFNDALWSLSVNELKIDSGRVVVDNFRAQHSDQHIHLDGVVSRNPADILHADLNKVSLDYIFESLNINALDFGGIATGFVEAKDLYTSRQVTADLAVTDFAFNDARLGYLELTGTWDEEQQGVLLDGTILNNDTSHVFVDGIIRPISNDLSITFDATNTDVAFLRKYLNKVTKDLKGIATGNIRLFGSLNHPTLEGRAYVKDGGFGIDFLNTYYTFSDYLTLKPDEIAVENILLSDRHGRTAQATGKVNHNLLKDWSFDAAIDFTNFLAYDAPKNSATGFYGTAYATGNVKIFGNEDLVDIQVNAINTDNTKIIFNFNEGTDVVEYDFINFITRNEYGEVDAQTANETDVLSTNGQTNGNGSKRKTDIRLSLALDVTPQAQVELVMNPSSGDRISASGSGSIRLDYSTQAPMKVFGNYTLEQGKYAFSWEQIVHRTFDIQEGSTISFSGDPNMADLDIKASYTVSANLGDLDQRLLEMNLSARSNVPVDCILMLTGSLRHPNIAFDLDLPGATDDLNRQVKSYIRTEDMMNRQFVYLLVLSRFYTSPEFVRTDGPRFNNDYSMLTSMISNQLSDWFGNISDHFTIGTSIHQSYEGEETNTEVEVLLSSQLFNNRLVINGNFGYIDNPYINNGEQGNVPLVGDFDIEYKLTPSGDIRLRGFNRYNYRNYYSQTPEMTQGLGILFRRDFNNIHDLFRNKRREIHHRQTAGKTEE